MEGHPVRNVPHMRHNVGILAVCEETSVTDWLDKFLVRTSHGRGLAFERCPLMRDQALGNGGLFLGGKYYSKGTVRTHCQRESARYVFQDFRSDCQRTDALASPTQPLLNFLRQFEDMEFPWFDTHFDETNRLITKCARFQTQLLSETASPMDSQPYDSLLIALSLRCLVLADELFLYDWIEHDDSPSQTSDGSVTTDSTNDPLSITQAESLPIMLCSLVRTIQ